MQPTHGGQHWTEAPGSGAAKTASPAVWRKDGGSWDLTTTGPAQGRMFDPGDGSWMLFDVSAEYVLIDDGAGGYELASSGTPVAVLADDGSGGLVVSSDLTAEAGHFYPDGGAGDVYPIRDDANELRFVSIGGNYQSF